MKTPLIVTSTQNPRIKEIRSMEKARVRKDLGLFCAEGDKEVRLALTGGYRIETLVYCPELVKDIRNHPAIQAAENLIEVSLEVFGTLAVRENSGGLLAVCHQRTHTLKDFKFSQCPLILVLESVEKPGNLGALLRTADAAGLDGVIICDNQTDVYNPNVIRSSTGCLFTMPLAITTSAEAINYLKHNDIKIWCTHLEASHPYYSTDFKSPSAIVMGTESTGLSEIWTNNSAGNIIIPMHGKTDSMNVSTAAAVVIFEALRQRTMI